MPFLIFLFAYGLGFSLSLSVYNPTKAFCGGTWRKHTQSDKFFFFFLNLSVVRNFQGFKVWQTDCLNIITMSVKRTHAKNRACVIYFQLDGQRSQMLVFFLVQCLHYVVSFKVGTQVASRQVAATRCGDKSLCVHCRSFVKMFVSTTELCRRNKSHKIKSYWICATCCGDKILLLRHTICTSIHQ